MANKSLITVERLGYFLSLLKEENKVNYATLENLAEVEASINELTSNLDNYLSLTELGEVIPSNSNLNSYITPGKYYVSSAATAATITNSPVTTSGYNLLVMKGYSSNRTVQIAIDNKGNTFIRSGEENIFQSWISLKVFTGAGEDAAGSIGLVPKPAAGEQNAFLKGDGTWTNIITNEVSITKTSAGQDIYLVGTTSQITEEDGITDNIKTNEAVYIDSITEVISEDGTVTENETNTLVAPYFSGDGTHIKNIQAYNVQGVFDVANLPLATASAPGMMSLDNYHKLNSITPFATKTEYNAIQTQGTELGTLKINNEDFIIYAPDTIDGSKITGEIPSSILPSYVDDIIESDSFSALPAEGEAGKIYVTTNDNKTYRWSGSQYTEVSASLALGETAETAFRGDRGVALESTVQNLSNLVGTESVDTSIANAISELDYDDKAVDGQYVTTVAQTDGKIMVIRADLPINTLATGTTNGTVKFNDTDVAVKGLGDAAYTTVSALNSTAKEYADAAETNAKATVTTLANGTVAENTAAIAAINNTSTGTLAQAKADATSKADAALASAKTYADGLIAGLDVTDTAVAGQYVSAVNEVDGKIIVTRAELTIPKVEVMTGATASAAGTEGLVPAPEAGESNRFLNADGTWQVVEIPELNYLPLSGGTVTGDVAITSTTAATNTTTGALTVAGGMGVAGDLYATNVIGAVWNDYAETRKVYSVDANNIIAGRVVTECKEENDTVRLTTKRLEKIPMVYSDTYGFLIGEKEGKVAPIAVAGRVLVYCNEDRDSYELGDSVCSGPNGTISKMTEEEIIHFPDRILGYVSCIPNYEEWGNGVKINNRIWIKLK